MHTFKTLITPSILSGFSTTLLACAIFGWSAWAYINSNQAFHTILFGPEGLQTIFALTPDVFSFVRRVLHSQFAYYFLIVFAGLFTTVITYILLQAFKKIAQRDYPPRYKELAVHIFAHIIVLLAWAGYILFFMGSVIQLGNLVTEFGIDQLQAGTLASIAFGLVFSVLAILIFACNIHIHIIFARLLVLRTRTFGERYV